MKSFFILLLICSFSVQAESLYSYECHDVKNNFFKLVQEFENGILIKNNLRFKKGEVIMGENKYDSLYQYESDNENNFAEIITLSWGIMSGTGFGKVYVSKLDVLHEYDCSLDWSPY